MRSKKTKCATRILDEMLETALYLHGHDLISEEDLAKLRRLCQAPLVHSCTPEHFPVSSLPKG